MIIQLAYNTEQCKKMVWKKKYEDHILEAQGIKTRAAKHITLHANGELFLQVGFLTSL